MFLALLAHPQEAPKKRHLVRCVRVMSIDCTTVALKLPCAVRTEHVHNIQVNCSVWTWEQTAITSLRRIDWLVLAAFVILLKGTVRYVMSVRPHGATRIPLDGLSWHFISDYFSKTNPGDSLKSDQNKRYYSHRQMCVQLCIVGFFLKYWYRETQNKYLFVVPYILVTNVFILVQLNVLYNILFVKSLFAQHVSDVTASIVRSTTVVFHSHRFLVSGVFIPCDLYWC
jgi:hypothetical protein